LQRIRGGQVAIRTVALVGTYRKGGTIDSAVDLILQAAASQGSEISKIYLLDKRIEFCTNCRSCTQQSGAVRGKCVLPDELEAVLSEIEAADALVLAAPVNFYNVNALFRRFMERTLGYVYWPWNKKGGPVPRRKMPTKIAALVTSAAMPGFLIPVSTGAPRALKITAKILGARPVASLYIGFSAVHAKQQLSDSARAKSRRIGLRLTRLVAGRR
jgi:putative NADPH-quinone reductase